MYNLLEYKYSTFAQRSLESKNLMGLSLELPRLYLNGSEFFDPPMSQYDDFLEPTQFLWQAPNSNAALYFGEKWVELHSFLSARISLQNSRVPPKQRAPTREKLISTSYPSWMEYFQELMRARDYSLLYPNFPNTEDAIVAIHEEHHQPPEEYFKTKSHPPSAPVPTLDPNDPFTTDPSDVAALLPVQAEPPLLTSNLVSLLPSAGDLPDITHIPILSHEGNRLSRSTSTSAARKFADQFRTEIGRCDVKAKLIIEPMSARDLFCNLEQLEGINDSYLEEDGSNDDDIEQSNTEEAKAKEDERIGEQSEGKAPEKIEKIEKIKQKQTPLKDEMADDAGQVQDEFSAHLQRQNGKAVHGKTGTSGTRQDDDGDAEKNPKEETKEKLKENVGTTTSDEVEEHKDKKKKSDTGATGKENARDEEKSTEFITKQQKKQPNKDGGQVTRTKVGSGMRNGNEQATTKDAPEKAAKKANEEPKKEAVAGTEKESSPPVENRGKQEEKSGAGVVRDRGW